MLGIPERTPKGEKTYLGPIRYVPSCKISSRSVPLLPRYL